MRAVIFTQDLKRLVKATKDFMGSHALRPAQQYIKLEFEKETLTVTAIATDGYRLSVEHASCTAIDEDFTAYIKATLPKCKSGDTAVIEVKDAFCYISTKDLAVGVRQPNGEFFDYQSFLQDQAERQVSYRIALNKNFLVDALRAITTRPNDPVIFEFGRCGQPMVIRTEKNKQDIKIVLPCRLPERLIVRDLDV